MSFSTDYLPGTPSPVPCLRLAGLAAAEVAMPGRPGLPLHLDCSSLPYQHTLGVCHQVSQLLLLRRQGFGISLHRVNPVLRRCLQQLNVAHLFTWAA